MEWDEYSTYNDIYQSTDRVHRNVSRAISRILGGGRVLATCCARGERITA